MAIVFNARENVFILLIYHSTNDSIYPIHLENIRIPQL